MKPPETKKINLLQTQRLAASVIMRPLTKSWALNRTWSDGRSTAAVIAPIMKPNDRLTAIERIEIYNKQYWFRLIECFGDDFPGLRAVIGEKTFCKLTINYLHTHPSRSYTLRNLGQFLIPFLEKNPKYTKPHTDLAVDMAKFEWAQIEAFDSTGHPPLSAEDLAKLTQKPAKLKLSLQPYLRLIKLRYALDDFLLAVKRGDSAVRGEASNAISEKTSSRKSKKLKLPERQEIHLAVHRYEHMLYYKRLPAEAFATLTALRKGATLEKALTKAIASSKNNKQNWPALIQEWFGVWTQLGWFCKPN